MKDSWHNTELGNKKYPKLLISRVTKNYENQKIYEDVITAELKKRGVDAIPIHAMLDKEEKVANKAALEKAVTKSGADALLSIQTTNVEQRTNVQPGYIDSYPGYWYPSAFPRWDMYGYYGGRSTYYEPPLSVRTMWQLFRRMCSMPPPANLSGQVLSRAPSLAMPSASARILQMILSTHWPRKDLSEFILLFISDTIILFYLICFF